MKFVKLENLKINALKKVIETAEKNLTKAHNFPHGKMEKKIAKDLESKYNCFSFVDIESGEKTYEIKFTFDHDLYSWKNNGIRIVKSFGEKNKSQINVYYEIDYDPFEKDNKHIKDFDIKNILNLMSKSLKNKRKFAEGVDSFVINNAEFIKYSNTLDYIKTLEDYIKSAKEIQKGLQKKYRGVNFNKVLTKGAEIFDTEEVRYSKPQPYGRTWDGKGIVKAKNKKDKNCYNSEPAKDRNSTPIYEKPVYTKCIVKSITKGKTTIERTGYLYGGYDTPIKDCKKVKDSVIVRNSTLKYDYESGYINFKGNAIMANTLKSFIEDGEK